MIRNKEMSIEYLVAELSRFTLEQRFSLMQEKLAERTRYLTVCLENVFQAQNASAVLRSADAFGVQDVHVVESRFPYRVNPDIALGSDKWLDIIRHASTEEAIESLKNNGYRIVAAMPEKNADSIETFDLNTGKVALLFGTELTGLSEYAVNRADERVYVPMCGFVESLNVSVSAAICMYALVSRLKASEANWRLDKDEKNRILFEWLKKSVRSSDLILKRIKN
ncbi:MAG: RNA methyltransferase [Prevotellaceae bacterium]|jgi:tRNA (guanosine-2'-O-)-methyltransferase|nr:RNA methyltransferase [Prevotellaceae bacterium]